MALPAEIVDAHIHLFDVHNTPRQQTPLVRLLGWNERLLKAAAQRAFPAETLAFFGEDNLLLQDYLTPEFRADSRPHGITQYVHVQAGWKDSEPTDAAGETRWLAGLGDPPAGIVGYADLSLGGAVGRVLDTHRNSSVRLRGIRHMLSNHPDPGVMDFAEDPDLGSGRPFRSGLEQLVEAGLSYDAWCYSHQLPVVADLANANPDLSVILCHGGSPVGFGGPFAGVGAIANERARIASRWRDDLAAVAANPNVTAKLSGFLMPCLGFGFDRNARKPQAGEIADRIGPLVRHCIDSFGPDRCMFGSNFPVDKVSTSYGELLNAMAILTETDGAAAQRQMFAGTARRIYRL